MLRESKKVFINTIKIQETQHLVLKHFQNQILGGHRNIPGTLLKFDGFKIGLNPTFQIII